MPSKYEALEKFLTATCDDVLDITLSFQQISAILGFALPDSALVHRQWWENQVDVASRPQAKRGRLQGSKSLGFDRIVQMGGCVLCGARRPNRERPTIDCSEEPTDSGTFWGWRVWASLTKCLAAQMASGRR